MIRLSLSLCLHLILTMSSLLFIFLRKQHWNKQINFWCNTRTLFVIFGFGLYVCEIEYWIRLNVANIFYFFFFNKSKILPNQCANQQHLCFVILLRSPWCLPARIHICDMKIIKMFCAQFLLVTRWKEEYCLKNSWRFTISIWFLTLFQMWITIKFDMKKTTGFNKEFHSRAEINLYCTHCLHKSISNLSRKIMNKYAAHFGNGVWCTLPLCTPYRQLCAVHFYWY